RNPNPEKRTFTLVRAERAGPTGPDARGSRTMPSSWRDVEATPCAGRPRNLRQTRRIEEEVGDENDSPIDRDHSLREGGDPGLHRRGEHHLEQDVGEP